MRTGSILFPCLIFSITTTVAMTANAGEAASITGQVVDADSAQPIVGAPVRLGRLQLIGALGFSYEFQPESGVPLTFTDANGDYEFLNLGAAANYAVLVAETMYVRSLSGVQACPPSSPSVSISTCVVSIYAGAFEVMPGESLVLPPIELEPAARLSGVVRNAADQSPVINARVRSAPTSGWSSLPTDSGGFYSIDHLPLGNHHLYVVADGFVVAGLDSEVCGWFNACTQPSVINLDQAQAYDRDVELTLSARIVPALSFNGASVSGLSRLYSESHPHRPSQHDPSFSGLPAGIYTLLATPQGFVPQYFDGLPCPGEDCPDVVPTPIVVEVGETRTVPMSMQPMRTLSGRVRDATTGEPLAGVRLELGRLVQAFGLIWHFNSDAVAWSDEDGEFVLAGFSEGNLDLVTYNDQHYIDVRYPSVVCRPHVDCNPDSGHPTGHFQFGTDTQISGLDVALVPGGRIAGTTRLFGQPHGASVRVQHADHPSFAVYTPSGGGEYLTSPGLIPGAYRVIAEMGSLAQLYDGIICPTVFTCPVDDATLIQIDAAMAIDGIDFDFEPDGERIFASGFEK